MKVNFDARQCIPSDRGQLQAPPPLGYYKVVISHDEEKGEGVVFHFKVIDSETGYKEPFSVLLNLNHSGNAQTAAIAQEQLSRFAWCTGVLAMQDTKQLHNIPFIIKAGPATAKPEFTNIFETLDANMQQPWKQLQQSPAFNPPAASTGYAQVNAPQAFATQPPPNAYIQAPPQTSTFGGPQAPAPFASNGGAATPAGNPAFPGAAPAAFAPPVVTASPSSWKPAGMPEKAPWKP